MPQKTLPAMPAPCRAAPKGHSGVQDQPRAPRHRRPSHAGPVPSELNGAFLQRAPGLEEKPALPGDGRREKGGLEAGTSILQLVLAELRAAHRVPCEPLVLLGSVPRPCCRISSPGIHGTRARVAAWVC